MLFAVLSYNSLGFHNQAPCHSSPSALRAIEAMKSDSREQARLHSSRTQTTGVEKTEERLESEKDCAAFFSYSCHYPFPLFGWFFFFFLQKPVRCMRYQMRLRPAHALSPFSPLPNSRLSATTPSLPQASTAEPMSKRRQFKVATLRIEASVRPPHPRPPIPLSWEFLPVAPDPVGGFFCFPEAGRLRGPSRPKRRLPARAGREGKGREEGKGKRAWE